MSINTGLFKFMLLFSIFACNEKIKEGDCLIPIDKIEGTVYEFQGNKNWSNVNGSFKEKVIKAMCELYCKYKKEGKTWKILEISSAYRTEREQAEAMVDYILVNGRDELVKIYENPIRRNPLNLISDLYYDGNHLGCSQLKCLHDISGRTCIYHNQQTLFNSLPNNEKTVFAPYIALPLQNIIDLKNNTDKAKDIMEHWLKVSGMKSHHQLGLALDFSSNTPTDQRKAFSDLLKGQEYRLFTSEYNAGNFHVYQK